MSEEKKSRKAPAFQFYADDFLAGTITMTNEEKGAYITLLCIQWSKGSLVESDFQRVCAGMPPHCQRICQSKFDQDSDGSFKNRRLESVRLEKKEYSEKQRNNANMRWHKDAVAMPSHMPNDANALPESMPNVCSPSPSPSPIKKETKAPKSPWDVGFGVELPEGFRNENCLQAVKLWLQHKSERGQSYKKTGLSKALTQWSNEFSASEFPSIVDHAIASNWAGIFRPKQSQQTSLPIEPQKKREYDWRDSL